MKKKKNFDLIQTNWFVIIYNGDDYDNNFDVFDWG